MLCFQKTEISNTFKSRYGSINEKKMLLFKGRLMLEVYNNGCSSLNINDK